MPITNVRNSATMKVSLCRDIIGNSNIYNKSICCQPRGGWKCNNYVMRVRVSICEECNYCSYAPPPITRKQSLLAFPSELKASLVLVAVHTAEVVPDKDFK